MRIKVIVNPRAGRRVAQTNLQQIIGKLLLDGTASTIQVTTTAGENDAKNAASACSGNDTDLIIGCGGDGTINEIVNGMMISGAKIPLAILAAGTSNDFASAMHLPDDIDSFCQMIAKGCRRSIDLGLANDNRYFINVASFGIFTDVSHQTPRDAKNNLGKFAYYFQAAVRAPEQILKSYYLEISTDQGIICDDFQLCIVANSTSVGTFRRLMYQADVSDGLFDVLLLKKKNILAITAEEISSRIISGELFKSSGVKYFQTKAITFKPKNDMSIAVDLDGEDYGLLPLTAHVCPRAIDIIVQPEEKDRTPFFKLPRE